MRLREKPKGFSLQKFQQHEGGSLGHPVLASRFAIGQKSPSWTVFSFLKSLTESSDRVATPAFVPSTFPKLS
jgi:hypothetical protein